MESTPLNSNVYVNETKKKQNCEKKGFGLQPDNDSRAKVTPMMEKEALEKR
jgi:hypothetical protein